MSLDVRRDRIEEEPSLLDYWRVLWKYRLLVIGICSVSVFTTGFHSYFIATKIYESKATILGPKESGGGGNGFATLMAASGTPIPFLGGLLAGGGSNRDTFIAILNSRTMAEELVERFRLQEYYHARYKEQAIRTLQDATDVTVSKEGVISIKVTDKNPKLAADVANAYVAHLDRLFLRFGATEASRQRAFIADRLDKTKVTLREAEEALRRFEEKNKTLAVSDQARGAIEAAGRVRGEIAAAEVQLEALRAFSTETNPNVVQQRNRVQELKRQLAQMQYGRLELPSETSKPGESRQEVHLPFAKAPEVGTELMRLMREVKVQETVFTLLTQQYEQAKIQEAKDLPAVQMLDRAVPAELKSRPKTVFNMGLAGLVSLTISTLLAFTLDWAERQGQKA